MPRTVIVEELGAADAMKIVDLDPGMPGPGEVRIRQTAIGVNFADVHYRRGTAPKHSMAKLPIPFTPGLEGVGFVEAVGEGVDQFKVGDRIAYASASLTIGAYAEVRLFPAERCFILPDDIRDIDAAALLYRAITVQGIIRQCYPVKAGDWILLHAAAGGIGTILSQWASHLGASVIGTVSAPEKAELALSNGCAHAIVHTQEDFVARTLEITNGKGVDVCFDGVGIAVFVDSLRAIRRYGTMVSFGQASGLVDPIDPIELQHEGLYLTKFSGGTYNDDVDEYQARAADVVAAIRAGVFKLGNHLTYSLEDVVQAHIDLETRKTTGSLVLVP
ncbi:MULTISPECIES: quinone oxidoreductase family protein [unclassified Sphingobium]|uniref:quinone oxidoreductase family protein n=1 Tax=unclassified Sphingobium TaxID=2611147 RepID=UPI000770565D|nr:MULTISPECIES: quinone oxidoreductase [unclassified Sphingobium]AMK21503.1 NADPH:quinone reductase [Sphingobium sp. TKS]NML91870.1 quinone oxidoreductase [Sphingobium sp. TB-6]